MMKRKSNRTRDSKVAVQSAELLTSSEEESENATLPRKSPRKEQAIPSTSRSKHLDKDDNDSGDDDVVVDKETKTQAKKTLTEGENTEEGILSIDFEDTDPGMLKYIGIYFCLMVSIYHNLLLFYFM